MTTSATARHRASVRPATPLSSLTTAVTGQIGVIGRGGVVVAMSSGLVATTGLPSQAADQSAAAPEPAAPPPVVAPADMPVGAAFQTALLPAISTQEAAELRATNSLSAPETADVPFETGSFKALPAPKPKAAPEATQPKTATKAKAGTAQSRRVAARTTAKAAAETAAKAAAKAAALKAAKQAAKQAAKPAAKPAAKSKARHTERPKAKAPSRSSSSRPASPRTSARGSSVLAIAARYVGVPYRYGGTTPTAWDCSGAVRYIYRQVGVQLPRTAHQQMQATTRVSRSNARPGDLVFFVSGGRATHMGIYAGKGMMYDAGRTGKSFSKRKIYTDAVVYGRV